MRSYFRPGGIAVVVVAATLCHPARAAEMYSDGDFSIRWDNTLKYTLAVRTARQDGVLTSRAAVNADDGDRSFNAGSVVSDRGDLLSELDVRFGDYGFSGSAAGWYDAVYNEAHNSNPQGSFNPASVSVDEFPRATRRIEGRYLELLNAFVYGKGDVAGTPVNVRVGRHTLIWGESLFAADNGIAYGQAPLDIIKASSVPNTQAKELFLPVGQISASAQILENLSVEAYEQFEWRKTRLPAADSFFSEADLLDDGGERIIAGAPFYPGGPPLNFGRVADRGGRAWAQFGLAVRWRPTDNLDLGLYALRYDDKEPQVYVYPGQGENLRVARIGSYRLGYARNIEMYGVSASTTLGAVNYGFEVSARRNNDFQALQSVVVPGRPADFDGHPLYPVGDSLHYQANAVWALTSSPLYDSALVLGEVFGSRILDISRNASNFPSDRRLGTLGLRVQAEPQYFQVTSGLDLSFPIGLGLNLMGRSGTTTTFNTTGAAHGGDVSFGVSAVYDNVWRGRISFTHYFGEDKINSVTGYETAPYVDRDFVSFSISHTL